MQIINIKDLDIGKVIGVGNWSFVNKCKFNEQEFSVKIFDNSYPEEIISNIISLTDIDFEKEYFTPLYLIESNNGHIIGYLMNYDDSLEKLKFDSYRDTIIMLKDARNIINNLHQNHKRFHGDAVMENMLFDKKSKKTFLLDFDISLKFGEELRNQIYFRLFIKDYLKYYKQDKNIDIYTFNIATLMHIYNYDRYFNLFEDIRNEKNYSLQSNNTVKKLAKELLLNDTRKPYSGEYIIDYL